MSSTSEQLAAFFSRHRDLLARERLAEVERSSLILSNCGPKLLEQKGLALGGLGVVGVSVGLGGKSLVELERPTAYHSVLTFPPHTLRPGDLARIEENVSPTTKKVAKPKKSGSSDAQRSTAIEGVVYKVSDTRIIIAVDPSESSSDDTDLPERCRVLKLANSVTYDRMEKTLDQLERTILNPDDKSSTSPVTQMMRVLLGISTPSANSVLESITFFNDGLNPSQKEAVRFALEAPEVACIHGPPGTGKTHTLVEIIRQLTVVTSANATPKRILVCGASNLSVDNILERLLLLPPAGEKAGKLKMTRIGHPARVMESESILNSTLEMKSGKSDQAELARDVKRELETALGVLSGRGKGVKGKGPRGAERRKLWDEVKELRKEYRKREGGVVKAVLGDSQIVLATCHSAGGRQLHNHVFDVVIIDEATQALEIACWIPILKAKKLILAGDPMQLPPTIISLNKRDKKQKQNKHLEKRNATSIPAAQIDHVVYTDHPNRSSANGEASDSDDNLDSSSSPESSSATELHPNDPAAAKPSNSSVVTMTSKSKRSGLRPPRTLETTLFDRLEQMYGSSIKRMLNVQYRMHSLIASFPSKTLYSSKLISDASVVAHLLSDLPNTHLDSEEEEKEVLSTPIIFFDTAGCEYFERVEGDNDEGSHCNENEAAVVQMWTAKLIEGGVLPSQIAIITPYQAQVTLLTSLLRPAYGPELEIGTVDGMQGREKEAVVISMVRSNDKREVGFLKEKRRLNVAMTRAKRHLCVVGDSSTVKHGSSYLKMWMAWLEAHADVKYAGLD